MGAVNDLCIERAPRFAFGGRIGRVLTLALSAGSP